MQITSVAEGSPAEKAGLQEGDYILAIDGTEVRYGSDITEINREHAGEEVEYSIKRSTGSGFKCPENAKSNGVFAKCIGLDADDGDGTSNPWAEFRVDIKLNPAEAEYLLGVTMASSQALSYSTWSAPVVGAGLTLQLTGETFKGLGIMVGNLVSGTAQLFSGDDAVRESGQEALSEVKDSVTGPVGIIGVLFPSFTAAGPTNLAFLAALISVSLACMNVLPIPALDGGRWFLIAIYKLRKKELSKETEEKIVSRAMVVLLALIAIVTILDIVRIAQ